jgi:hypothetical protein
MAKTGAPQGLGDFKEYTNGGSDAVTWASPNLADWAQIIGAGSTVLTTEAGAAAATPYNRTITTDANEPAGVWRGPFSALVSTTATRVRMGIGAPPVLPPVVGVSPVVNAASTAALSALTAAANGQQFQIAADGSNWRYVAASTLTADGLLVVAATGIGSGAFLRTDRVVDLILPITFATAASAVLYTVPTGWRLDIVGSFWEVTTSWTGGSSSAIGLSSSNAGLSTSGNVLGGSGGDVAATLVSTGALAKGTVGAGLYKPGAVLVGGDTIKFNQITSAFTAGAGNAHVSVNVLLAPAQ